jgi:hypothetical protein
MKKNIHYKLAELFNKAYLKADKMEKGISGFKAAGVFPLNPEKFTEIGFELDEDVNIVVFKMAKEESVGGGDQHTHSVAAQVNPQNVIAPEPQAGPSRTVTVPELLPLSQRRPESTASITKTDVRKQNSEIDRNTNEEGT